MLLQNRKSDVTSGWLSVSANNYNADRSVAAGRSARFYGQVYNPPCVGSRSGAAQGAALLTKFWRTAIIKTERALPRVVSLSKSCISKFYADRLAATERSARFYGQCQGQNDHTHQKSPRKFIHSSFTPFPHGIRKGLANHFSIVTTHLSGPFDRAFLF